VDPPGVTKPVWRSAAGFGCGTETLDRATRVPAGEGERAAQRKAKSVLHEIWMAEARAEGERAFERFLATYSAKYPKATACLAEIMQGVKFIDGVRQEKQNQTKLQ
jgi:hypothetical protein